MSRLTRLLAGAGLCSATTLGLLAPSLPAAAAPTAIDVTISETIPATTGTLTAGTLPDCPSPVVHTENATASSYGSTTVFRGDKRFDCGGGNEFTLRFVAAVSGCASYDFGAWRAAGGTGSFAGVRGSGVLVGTYTNAGSPADACTADGIDDRYVGVLRH